MINYKENIPKIEFINENFIKLKNSNIIKYKYIEEIRNTTIKTKSGMKHYQIQLKTKLNDKFICISYEDRDLRDKDLNKIIENLNKKTSFFKRILNYFKI